MVYAYHAKELFAQEVIEQLRSNYDLPNTRIVKFPPKRFDPKKDEKDFHKLMLRGFARQYLPFEFLLDIHSSPDAVDVVFDKGRHKYIQPSCGFIYTSKTGGSQALKESLEAFSKKLDNEFPDRYVERKYMSDYMSSKYGMFSIELMPHYITNDQSVKYLKELIETLHTIPRNSV